VKYHHVVSDNGQFFRQLRNNHSVNVDHGGQKPPPKPTAPVNTRAYNGAAPLITDNQDTVADAHSWNVVSTAAEGEGEIPWILRGPPENVAKAKAQISAALEAAAKNTTTGYLVLPDPATYRYVRIPTFSLSKPSCLRYPPA
jgi:hypothetical protein